MTTHRNRSSIPGLMGTSNNIVLRLMSRESNLKRRWTPSQVNKDFYKNIYPNTTIVNVPKPSGYIRKFSPDGRYLICISTDQTAIVVYEYKGVAKAAPLMKKWKFELVPQLENKYIQRIQLKMFDTLFCYKHTLELTTEEEPLHRECSLFTEDKKHIIVVSSTDFLEGTNMYTSNECIPILDIQNYTIFVVDYIGGKRTDQVELNSERLYLGHNQALSLYKNTLAVMSVKNQCIYVYCVIDGKLVPQTTVGKLWIDVEYAPYSIEYWCEDPYFAKENINSLKHGLLTCLYHMSDTEYQRGVTTDSLNFLSRIRYYNHLRLWKMQLIDNDHLLIKYASEDIVIMEKPERTNASHIIIYKISEDKVLSYFGNSSPDLLEAYVNFTDVFRNTSNQSEVVVPSSPANNYYAHEYMRQQTSSDECPKHAAGVLLSALPISSQSFSSSPFLDMDLFEYDPRYISACERPKTLSDFPILFADRETGVPRFRLYSSVSWDVHAVELKNLGLISYIFHPYEPFAISVEKTTSGYVTNFHLRSPHTVSME